MEAHLKVLNAVKIVGGSSLAMGVMISFLGFIFHNSLAVGIGLGAAVGAIFIFIMGVFFVATEEMLATRYKGQVEAPIRYRDNVIPFKLK